MKWLSAIFLTLLVAVAVASQKGANLGAWKARYNQAARLFQAKNAKALTRMMTSDYKSYGPNGQVQMQGNNPSMLERQFSQLKTMKVSFNVQSAKTTSAGVVVRATYVINAVPKSGDKKVHHVMVKGLSDETWIKKGSRWLLHVSRTIRESTVVDGKPISGAMR